MISQYKAFFGYKTEQQEIMDQLNEIISHLDEYTNEDGVLCEIAEGGWMSAIIQHEMDHFEGICQVYESTKEEINK